MYEPGAAKLTQQLLSTHTGSGPPTYTPTHILYPISPQHQLSNLLGEDVNIFGHDLKSRRHL